ncbi:unnamed protein product [Arctia plantaginis]|uniref:Uncharacterized protein n=1 Tax=Arctia plantaginis TaxID=874455 RepID=A0A8S1B2W1_ARCPL|nr:unnamed protein product [Arctia plantaginis]
MVNVQMVLFLFALLVSSTVTIQRVGTMVAKSFSICNSYKEAGFKCIGCHERLVCLPFNIGFTWTCGHIHPYCNNGFCSKTMGSMCTSETTDKSASSATPSASEGNATACTSESSRTFSD